MSKPIKFNTIINRIGTRQDGSLSLSMETPELTNEEILVVLRLCGINLDCTLTPLLQELEAPLEVKSAIETKTPSQRIRSVLFALFKYEMEAKKIASDTLFEYFYQQRCERIIEWLKTKLPEQ